MASAEVNSQPRQQPIFWNHVVGWIRSIPRAAILSLVGPSFLCVIGYFGWLYYGAHNLDMAYYGLKKENIHITDQPAWLRKTNVLNEVFDGSALAHQSLLDSKTAGYLASVFSAHPCVRKAHRVERLAGGVKVDLEYRMPVAMVALHRDTADGQPVYFPVDADAVLLDTINFNKEDIPRYISIHARGNSLDTNAMKGKPFGDPRIEEAARLCGFLLTCPEAAKISKVQVYPSNLSAKTKWLLEIDTTSGQKFKWGSSPGLEGAGELLAAAKLANLTQLLSADGKLGTQLETDLTRAQLSK